MENAERKVDSVVLAIYSCSFFHSEISLVKPELTEVYQPTVIFATDIEWMNKYDQDKW